MLLRSALCAMLSRGSLKILFIGDIVGEPGRKFVKQQMRGLLQAHTPDLVIANGENAAAVSPDAGHCRGTVLSRIHVLTSGTYLGQEDIEPYLGKQNGSSGRRTIPKESGFRQLSCDGGLVKVAVLNLKAGIHVQSRRSFRKADQEVERLKKETR